MPLVGRQLGNYIIKQRIASGGMGTIYRAEHIDIGQTVAVKALVDPRLAETVGSRFVAEARLIAKIRHPNVIQLYDFGRTADGYLYYVMELLRGNDLSQLIAAHGPLAVDEVVPLMRQICSGLQAAHDQSIVHRDLKPENIFVSPGPPPQVKLLDFGVGKVVGPSQRLVTQIGAVIGTPAYMAPEQASGRSDQTSAKTDMYGLGATLYTMLTADVPTTGDPTTGRASLATLPPGTPSELLEVARHCMAQDPAQRPESALAVLSSLEKAVASAFQSEPPSVRNSTVTIPAEERRHGRRFPATLWATLEPGVSQPQLIVGDISLSGIYLPLPEVPGSPGQVHWLRLADANRRHAIRVLARMARRKHGEGQNAATQGWAFEFLLQSTAQYAELQRFVYSSGVAVADGPTSATGDPLALAKTLHDHETPAVSGESIGQAMDHLLGAQPKDRRSSVRESRSRAAAQPWLHGSLGSVTLPKLLAYLAYEQLSGQLEISGASVSARIRLRRGCVDAAPLGLAARDARFAFFAQPD